MDDDCDDDHYESNGITIRKMFGHLINRDFGKVKGKLKKSQE